MNGRRLRAAVLASLVLGALLHPGCGGGSGGAANRIVVATEAAYPPFEMKEPGGAITGFDVELVRAAAREAGLAAEFVDQPFDGLIPGLQQGKYDAAVSCITITAERASVVDFTEGYYDAGQVIAVREDETRIKGLDDLRGMTIAVQMTTTGNDQANRVKDATVKTFKAIEPAFMELKAKRADAVINDDPTTFLYAKEHGGIRIVGKPFTEERYGIAVRKGNAELLRKLNDGLRKVRASGEYDRLKSRWIEGK